ncbi:hypothetical protein [Maricaulis sp.]|uniref:hypothetical protein n=1 Tax=Maricaulis sp. TaxID=1486257 RepID=UPI002611DA63|nr:hypothetical protein [Maricaulis sp.]
MQRILVLALVCAGLTACGATTTGGAGGDLAMSNFEHSRSGGAPSEAAGFGYSLAGGEGWDGNLEFLDEPGEPAVAFAFNSVHSGNAAGELEVSMPYLDEGVRRYHGESEAGEIISIQLQAGPCRQSGRTYTHFAAVRVGDIAVTGCAMERAEQDSWSNYLMSYLPAIDACLAEVGPRARHVSLAYETAGGNPAIRLVDDEGRSWECTMRAGGEAINSLRPLTAADAIYGEGDPIFVRGNMPEGFEGCYVYESVREADGSLIGAFGYDVCDSGPAPSIG